MLDPDDKPMLVLCKNIELALKEKTTAAARYSTIQPGLTADHSLIAAKEEALKARFKSRTPRLKRSGGSLGRIRLIDLGTRFLL